MKKQYILPSMKAYNVQTASFIAASGSSFSGTSTTIPYSGTNKVPGGPTKAEGKSGFFFSIEDEDEE